MALRDKKFPFIQLQDLERVDDDITSEKYGHYPDKRPLNELFQYGVILLDKPPGPTSHEVIAWIKKLLRIEKAGHSGTLDPVLPDFCRSDSEKEQRRYRCYFWVQRN